MASVHLVEDPLRLTELGRWQIERESLALRVGEPGEDLDEQTKGRVAAQLSDHDVEIVDRYVEDLVIVGVALAQQATSEPFGALFGQRLCHLTHGERLQCDPNLDQLA